MTKFYLRDFDGDFPGHRYDSFVPLELLDKTRAFVRQRLRSGKEFQFGESTSRDYDDEEEDD